MAKKGETEGVSPAAGCFEIACLVCNFGAQNRDVEAGASIRSSAGNAESRELWKRL